jgi:hypothetical protein
MSGMDFEGGNCSVALLSAREEDSHFRGFLQTRVCDPTVGQGLTVDVCHQACAIVEDLQPLERSAAGWVLARS